MNLIEIGKNPEILKSETAEQPDILILDIEMPQKSGIEIKNELTKDDKPLIIFATAYFEFMKEAFGKNVIGYMQKPVKKFEFDNYMKTAIGNMSFMTIWTPL